MNNGRSSHAALASRRPVTLLASSVIFALGLMAPMAIASVTETATTSENAVSTTQAATSVDIDALIAKMTLEEKAGQMTQLTLSYFVADEGDGNAIHGIDPDKLREAIVNVGVGSILNNVTQAFEPEQWRDIIGEVQRIATTESRLRIPIVYGIDSVHGANYVHGATIMPQNLTLAATWNPKLAEDAGRVTADETRAAGMPWNFAPDADSGRQPLWSRVFETFGEDPTLSSAMVASAVRGMQGDDVSSPDRVAACVKHFVGYSTPRTGHDRTPVTVATWDLYEHHLPAFRAAIDAGVKTLMINSGEVNGVPVHASRELLTDLLRTELGFTGVAVTDWADVNKLHDFHRIATSRKEAALMAVEAGIDMSMVPESVDFAQNLVELVREGRLSETRLDESVRRILMLKRDLGLFETPMADESEVAGIGKAENQAVSLEAAREGLVLLRNRADLLPLAAGTRVLVTGPTSDRLSPLYGAWSFTWQGTDESLHPDTPTVLDGVREVFGEANVGFSQGVTLEGDMAIDAAVRAAAQHDVILVCLGEPASTEMMGNIADLELDTEQLELVHALAVTGKPIVGAMITNRPRTFASVEGAFDAFIWLGQPGPYGPQALAEIMAGTVNPSGKLPFTYPRYPNVLLTYDMKGSENDGMIDPADGFETMFDFGDGMGFSPFEYTDLRLERVTGDDSADPVRLRAHVRVRNAGVRRGAEVVQLYVTDQYASITPPAKRLRGFDKVTLGAGESRTVSFDIHHSALSFYNNNGELIFEPGDFTIHAGGLNTDITVR